MLFKLKKKEKIEKIEKKTVFPTSETLLTQIAHFPKKINDICRSKDASPLSKNGFAIFSWGVVVGSKGHMRIIKAFAHAFVVGTWITAGTAREITAFMWDEQPPCRLQFPLCSLLQSL